MEDYACDTCGVIELLSKPPCPPFQCTCCMGKPWHDLYPKVVYDPEQHRVANRPSGIGLS